MKNQKGLIGSIQKIPKAIYTCDELGFIKTFNKAAADLWGREPMVGKDLWCGAWKIFNADGSSLSADNSPMAKTIKQGKPFYGGEMLIQRPDGSLRFINPYPSLLYNDKGELTGGINILVDVTEKVNDIDPDEQSYKLLVEEAADGIFLFDQAGNFISANTSGCTMLGYSKQELASLHLNDIISEKDKPNVAARLAAFKNGLPLLISKQFIKKDEGTFFAEVNAKLLADGCVQAIVRDITQRKKEEQQLLNAIERYDIVTKATTDTIWDWDILNNKIIYNEGIAAMLGYQLTEVEDLAAWWKKNIHPDDFKNVYQAIEGAFENMVQDFQFTYRFLSANGSYKYIFDRALAIYDHQGKPCRMIGVMQDITFQQEEDDRIAKAIIDAQENERHQIGLELHDNVNQILTGCLLNLGMIKNSTPEKVGELVEMSRGHILTAIEELRKLTHRLVPGSMENVSLKKLFESLMKSMNIESKYRITINFDDFDNAIIDDEIELNLYRIVQEQLTNIVKYSKATVIDISVSLSKNHIILKVLDNGKGFDARLVKTGIGLGNMKTRAQLFGGIFTLNTSEGNGCEIIVEIPLHIK